MGNFQSEIRYGIDPSRGVNLKDLTPKKYSIQYVKDGLPDHYFGPIPSGRPCRPSGRPRRPPGRPRRPHYDEDLMIENINIDPNFMKISGRYLRSMKVRHIGGIYSKLR